MILTVYILKKLNVLIYLQLTSPSHCWFSVQVMVGFGLVGFKFVNLGVLKFSILCKNPIFPCMGEIFWEEFQRYPLKFHIKYLTHTLKDALFAKKCRFMSSQIYELVSHYSDVIMGTMASQITSIPIVYSTVYSGAAFVWGIHQ